MFAREHKQEYDPTSSPVIERPLATGRPLSVQQGNAYGGSGLGSFHQGENKRIAVNGPLRSPIKTNSVPEDSISPSKALSSPTKSSMSAQSRYSQVRESFNPETSIWSEEEEEDSTKGELPPGKTLRRHAKSVTFDAAPPQVNEYEMTTPDPSSVASGSREGSYDSVNEGEDESFDRGSSDERDDSFDASLEDTEKTPVVLPEDWRFMSPAIANEDLAVHVENPFNEEGSSPAPKTQPSTTDARPSPSRTDSVNSNGERRPLPPLPALGMPKIPHAQSDSNNSFPAPVERASSFRRRSPSPPRPASITKAEIQGMGGCSMSIEDRLRLMMIDDPNRRNSLTGEQREQDERLLPRGSPLRGTDLEKDDREVHIHEEEVENDDVADLGEYKLPPRISRESILRKVKSRTFNEPEDENSFVGLSPISDKSAYNNLDPDTPLPSLETEAADKEVIIKQEPDLEEGEVDVYSIPDLYSQQLQAESYMNAIEKLEAFQASSAAQRDDDDESHYSVDSKESGHREHKSDSATDDEGPPTPRALTSNQPEQEMERKNSHRMSLPQFAALLGESDFGFDMGPFMAPLPDNSGEPVKPVLSSQPSWTSDVPTEKSFVEQSVDRPVTPEEQLQPPRFPGQWNDSGDEPKTPDSVIHHSISQSPLPDSPSVPEPVATIKAPGGKLKTRPSVTPADVEAMAEIRRQVSNGSQVPAVPKIPERHLSRPSVVPESNEPLLDAASETASVDSLEERDPSKLSKRKSSLLPLEVSMQAGDGLGLGIESEFDRVIEAQKVAFNFPTPDMASRPYSPGHAEHMPGQEFKPFREGYANKAICTQKGYLMRQNTKVIIASSASHESAESITESKDTQNPAARGTRSAGNSPRKPSHTQTWTAEPWNGKIRRKSIRKSGGVPSKAPGSGPAPPLPGQQSNVASGLGSVTEDDSAQDVEQIGEDGERGRLFVKVVRVKDLDLPLPKGMTTYTFPTSFFVTNENVGERSYFALTLDNGLHCVTTAWLELGKTAPIGQEFELVVLNELEFQLTLQTKIEEPKAKPVPESPTKSTSPSKPSTFSRVFASPRKRKEQEMKRQEEAQQAERQRQQASRRPVQPTAWDLLHNLVAKDGSFARSYVCLKDHEDSAYGMPFTVDIPCFNEWATEDAHNMSSVKSKRSVLNGGVQRKAPYRIGKLELQLLFVPKPKDAKDEDMPKSMNACIRELREAESAAPKKWEGHLSQQGGDCPVSLVIPRYIEAQLNRW